MRVPEVRRRPLPFWPVAILGGLVVVAVGTGTALLVLLALGASPLTPGMVVPPVVVCLAMWVAAMVYAKQRRGI